MKRFFTALAAVVVLVLIGGGVVHFLQSRNTADIRGGEGHPQQEAAQPEGEEKPPQPDDCPRVEVISAPGTWESAADDDPLNPQANPKSFMLSITKSLQSEYTPDDVKVWTLPYTAQFKNINSREEMSYDESRDEGTSKLENELHQVHDHCPATKFLLTGFSQGAVLTGDVADRIGTGNGPVPADAVAGVALIADGRRENGVGINPGNELGGIGAEIALEPVSGLVQPIVPGATMRGKRPGGFGALADRTYQICAPDDSVCDAPLDVQNGLDRARDLIEANGVHAMYATNENVIPGTTANQWVVNWARDTINGV